MVFLGSKWVWVINILTQVRSRVGVGFGCPDQLHPVKSNYIFVNKSIIYKTLLAQY